MSDCAVISTAVAEKTEENIMTVLDELLQYVPVKGNYDEFKQDEEEKDKTKDEVKDVHVQEVEEQDELEKKEEPVLEKNDNDLVNDKEETEKKDEMEPEDPKPEEEDKELAADEVQEMDDLNKTMNTVERKTVKELREYYQLQNDLANKKKLQEEEEEIQFIDFDEVPLTPMQQAKEEKATQAPDTDNSTPKKKKNPIGAALRRGLRWVNGKIRREKNYML